jgi:hypothetical protein
LMELRAETGGQKRKGGPDGPPRLQDCCELV